ncbi:hypothetical protein [Gordonia sp. i37]|uniref:hypothetical protein n=1 Tax=Gordonia sp. i37 TaxID=1961707 RepID=UPI00209AE8C2|nr:hypothetical protein [Gordonia sp. i37]
MNDNPLADVTAEQIDAYGLDGAPTASEAVAALNRLVGEWTVTGGPKASSATSGCRGASFVSSTLR